MGSEPPQTKEAGSPAAPSLSTQMKSALALMAAWILFLLVGVGLALLSGPFDIYAAASLIFAVPYLVFLYFGLKARRWAYLGSVILSVIVIILTAFTFQPNMSAILLWETSLATLLSALVAVEGFKGYLELGSSQSSRTLLRGE